VEVDLDGLLVSSQSQLAAQGAASREAVPGHILTGCIRRLKEGMQLAVKGWRVRFSVENREVRVVGIVSGSKASQLARGQPR